MEALSLTPTGGDRRDGRRGRDSPIQIPGPPSFDRKPRAIDEGRLPAGRARSVSFSRGTLL